MTHHNQIDGSPCPGCLSKFQAYPDFYLPLQEWFFKMQSIDPAFHVVEAGRGATLQESYFNGHASKAHYGESAHNFNAAIDTFFQDHGRYVVDASRYQGLVSIMSPSDNVKWYGEPDAQFKETPHFEVANWRELRDQGLLKLVE